MDLMFLLLQFSIFLYSSLYKSSNFIPSADLTLRGADNAVCAFNKLIPSLNYGSVNNF